MKLKCEICNKEMEFPTLRGTNWAFTNHIKQHGFKDRKEYYDKFYRSENEGKCKICGKETSFHVSSGYLTYCSNKCCKKDPDYNSKRSNTLKEKYKDPELKKFMSEIAKKLWEDPEQIEKHKKRMDEVKDSDEFKKFMSEISKIAWSDPEFRERQRVYILEKWKNLEFRNAQLESVKKLWKNEEFLKIKKESLEKQWSNPSYVNMMSEKAVKRLQDKNNNFGKRNNRGSYKEYKQSGIFMRSNLEREFASILDENNISWEYESKTFILNNEKTKRYTPDFYLSDYSMFIEIKPKYFIDDESLTKVLCLREKYNKNIIFLSDKKEFTDFINNIKKF